MGFELDQEQIERVKNDYRARCEVSGIPYNKEIAEKIISLVSQEIKKKISEQGLSTTIGEGFTAIIEQTISQRESKLENMLEQQARIVLSDDDYSNDDHPSDVEIFGTEQEKPNQSYQPMNTLNKFAEDIVHQSTEESERESIKKYILGIIKDIPQTPRFYVHTQNGNIFHDDKNNKFFDPNIIHPYIEDCINHYKHCKEKNIKPASSTKELIKNEQVQEAIRESCKELGIEVDESRIERIEDRINKAMKDMKLLTLCPTSLIAHITENDVQEYLKKRKKTKKQEKEKLKSVEQDTKVIFLHGSGKDSKEYDFKEQVRQPPEKKQETKPKEVIKVKRKNGTYLSGILAGIIGTTAGGIILLYSLNKHINYNETGKEKNKAKISAVEVVNIIDSKLEKYVLIKTQEKINQSQNNVLGRVENKLNINQEELNQKLKNLKQEIQALEKKPEYPIKQLEQLVKDYSSLKQEIKAVDSRIGSIKAETESSAEEKIDFFAQEYKKLLQELTEKIEITAGEYKIQNKTLQSTIQEIKTNLSNELETVKIYLEKKLTDLEQSMLESDIPEEQPKIEEQSKITEEQPEKQKTVSKPKLPDELIKKIDEWKNK